MNHLTQSILPGAGCVAAGFALAWLVMRAWNLLHPTKPTTGRQLPTDKTTAVAAHLSSAAMLIQDRLYEADAISTALEQDELLQLTTGRRRIESALNMLSEYESREYRKLCPPIDFGLPVSEGGAGLNEPKAGPHHSTTPSLQHSN